MEWLTIPNVDRLGAVSTFIVIALLVITDKLVWHTRLKQAEARADRWEDIALKALQEGALAGVQAAEVAVGVVAALPDPQGRRDAQQGRLDADRAREEAGP